MFSKEKATLKNAVKRSVQAMIQHENGDWPPKCSIILYQPHRPKKNTTTKGNQMNK